MKIIYNTIEWEKKEWQNKMNELSTHMIGVGQKQKCRNH